jgi:hypothetical protein
MSICPETTVLRGPIAENAPLAHVNIELRNGRFLIGSKPHLLLNPDLQRAFDEATAAARAAAAAEGFAAGYANGRVQAVAEAELRLAGELAAVRESSRFWPRSAGLWLSSSPGHFRRMTQ